MLAAAGLTKGERPGSFRKSIMTDVDAGAISPPQGEGPGIRVLAQFARDLSFENPLAPESLRAGAGQPQIDLGVEMNARGRDDGLYEVDLKLSARAEREGAVVFHVELLYGGLFELANVADADLEPVLLIECPRFLFPFARRLIADVTSEGGFPPFLLDPIDFAAVYAQRRAEAAGMVGQA
jgi:preprotein translocase subunit SecB